MLYTAAAGAVAGTDTTIQSAVKDRIISGIYVSSNYVPIYYIYGVTYHQMDSENQGVLYRNSEAETL